MKKTFTCLLAVLLAALSGMTLTACGSDDDDDSGPVAPGKVPSPTLADSQGNKLRVTSVGGSVWFSYDDNGKLTGFGDNSGSYSFNNDAFTIAQEGATYNIAMNGQGLISRVSITVEDHSDNGSYEKASAMMSYRYNSDRQLVSITGSTYYEEYDKGSSTQIAENTSGTYRLTWNNGNLEKSVMESTTSVTEKGEKYSYKEAETIMYSYGSQPNVFRQLPYYMGENFCGEAVNIFCVLGLYGVGPAYLPTGYASVETGDDYEPETHNRTISFTLNDNGSIYSEKLNNGGTLVYAYDSAFTRAETGQRVEKMISPLPVMQKIRQLFKRR